MGPGTIKGSANTFKYYNTSEDGNGIDGLATRPLDDVRHRTHIPPTIDYRLTILLGLLMVFQSSSFNSSLEVFKGLSDF